MEEEIISSSQPSPSTFGPSTSGPSTTLSSAKRGTLGVVPPSKKARRDEEDAIFSHALATLDKMVDRKESVEPSEEDIFGSLLAKSLKALPTVQLRAIAMHKINNVMFEMKCLGLNIQTDNIPDGTVTIFSTTPEQ